ncbi:hypothetical protein D0Y65_029120 [Glycine soja]|uniref:Uncharacterized protein n=1 Tax=Glycine soja TaxID=3848 RepID=A0A445HYJ3_GLYSO|nr:hypothetical protein D0Y65_029120 [Glycine soja]
MAFMISRAESEAEKSSLKHMEDKDSTNTLDGVSSQLQLKSSLSSKASAQTLNKQQVLNRIRHRKSLNRIKGAFQGLLGNSKVSMMLNTLPWCQICCQWCYISRDGLELEAKKTRATKSASQISDLTVEGDEAIVHGVNDGGNIMGVNLE